MVPGSPVTVNGKVVLTTFKSRPGGLVFPKLLSRRIVIRFFERFYKIEWKPERRNQLNQFGRRLTPLILALLFAGFGFIAAINPIIRQNLNRNATETLSSRYLSATERYFSPLFQFMSTASLWTSIGNIESIGEPALYVESLHQSLEILGTASAMSLLDAEGRELVFRIREAGQYDWYVTDVESDDSLVTDRQKQNVEYLNLSDVGEYSTFYGEYPVWFRLSKIYELPGGEGTGTTIRATIGNRDSERSLRLWLDLPSVRMAEWLDVDERYPDAVILLVLPGNEYVYFSPHELEIYLAQHDASAIPDVGAFRSVERDFIVEALGIADIDEAEKSFESRFNYEGRPWQADYRKLRIGTQDITLGVFIPVDSLWTSNIYLPVQITVLLILFVAVLLLLILVRDFRINAVGVSEAEILRQNIDGGESSSLEFKSSLRWDYRQGEVNKDLEGVIMKSVAAFSNVGGGTLLIGVDDSGKSLGLEHDYASLKESGRDYFELHLRSLLIGQYGTDVASRGVKVDFVSLEDNDVCRLVVVRGKKPLYTTLSSKSGAPVEKFFIRSGNSSRAITSLAEITSYVVNRFGRQAVE